MITLVLVAAFALMSCLAAAGLIATAQAAEDRAAEVTNIRALEDVGL